MKNRIQFVFVLFLSAVGAYHASAQTIGSPAGVRGAGEWTISVLGTYMDQQIGTEAAISRRLLLKSNWGVLPWLDFYLIGGGCQLELQKNVSNVIGYKSKYKVGYGAGFHASLFPRTLSGIGLSLGVQALRFPSEGSFQVMEDTYDQTFSMRYDWREFRAHLGVVIPVESIRFYLAGIGWAVQRMDVKNEYWGYGDASSYLGETRDEFRSGIWTGGLVGIELLFPKHYAISLEALFFNEKNFHLTLGVSQTGGTEW